MHFGLALPEHEIHNTAWSYNLVWFEKQLQFRYCNTDARNTGLKKLSFRDGMSFHLSFAKITFAGEVIFVRILLFSCSVFTPVTKPLQYWFQVMRHWQEKFVYSHSHSKWNLTPYSLAQWLISASGKYNTERRWVRLEIDWQRNLCTAPAHAIPGSCCCWWSHSMSIRFPSLI